MGVAGMPESAAGFFLGVPVGSRIFAWNHDGFVSSEKTEYFPTQEGSEKRTASPTAPALRLRTNISVHLQLLRHRGAIIAAREKVFLGCA